MSKWRKATTPWSGALLESAEEELEVEVRKSRKMESSSADPDRGSLEPFSFIPNFSLKLRRSVGDHE